MKTKFKIIRKLLNIKKNPVHTDKTILKYDTVHRTQNVYKVEVKGKDRQPTINAGARTKIWISKHALNITCVDFDD